MVSHVRKLPSIRLHMPAESFLLHVMSGAKKIIEIHNLEAVVSRRSTNLVWHCPWGVFLKIAHSV